MPERNGGCYEKSKRAAYKESKREYINRKYVKMDSVDIERKSSQIKHKACEDCMKRLKGVLSDEQIQIFENAFYRASKGYIFREKEN